MSAPSPLQSAGRPLRIVRYNLWAVVAILIVVVALFAFDREQADRMTASAIGGPFALVDQNGATVTEAALQGHPSALFFGYTFCPDVCPTTLYEATQWLKALGPNGDKLKVYFVTVDPERDTQSQMASYLSAFDPRITGLTGTRPQIDAMLKAFRVYSKKVGDGPDYAMDHTAAIYLLNDQARMVGTADYQEKQETVMAKLKRLIDGA